MPKVLVIDGPQPQPARHPRGRDLQRDHARRRRERSLRAQGEAPGVEVLCFQSNHEGAIVDTHPRGARRGRSLDPDRTPVPTPIPAWRSATRSPGGRSSSSKCTSPTYAGVNPSATTPTCRTSPRRVMAGFGVHGYALALQVHRHPPALIASAPASRWTRSLVRHRHRHPAHRHLQGRAGRGARRLAVPFMSMWIPPRDAVAVVLPILIVMDMVGIRVWRARADWGDLRHLDPGRAAGHRRGDAAFGVLSDRMVRLVLGLIAPRLRRRPPAASAPEAAAPGERPRALPFAWLWGRRRLHQHRLRARRTADHGLPAVPRLCQERFRRHLGVLLHRDQPR